MKKTLILTAFLLMNFALTVAQADNKTTGTVKARDRSVKNAAYSAEVATETTQTLPDGNKIKRTEKQSLYRDKDGRTRRDSESVFNNTTRKSIHITDPLAGYDYYINHDKKIVSRTPVRDYSARIAEVPKPNGYSTKSESLGKKVIDGIETDGMRSVTTVAAGTVGNEKPIETISETWFSPELRTIILTKRTDPQMGDYVFQLKNIKREEPDASLFIIPADYKIVEGANLEDRYFIVSKP